MNNIELIQLLQGMNKPYFTVADFEKILDMDRDSLYVTLNRLEKKGILVRLKRGVYVLKSKKLEIERIANELYYPSYLSFESALAKFGILSQIPYSLTFATTNTPKKLDLAGREVEYRQLKEDCFFGYTLQGGVYVADPEKAILDQLYMMSKGKSQSEVGEWTLVGLNEEKFVAYSKKFPKTVQRMAKSSLLNVNTPIVGVR